MSERKIEWVVWGGMILTALALLAAFVLPAFISRPLPILGALPDFALTDQDGQPVSLASLRGNVWIADAIFTRCAGQCPLMSAHLRDIQDALPAGCPVKLVSFTTDPTFDTPAVLKKYAARYGARDGQWLFLTGAKAALHHATVEGLKLAAVDKPPAAREYADDLFIHSQKLVVIDQNARIRGYYDGETADGVARTLAAAKALARR